MKLGIGWGYYIYEQTQLVEMIIVLILHHKKTQTRLNALNTHIKRAIVLEIQQEKCFKTTWVMCLFTADQKTRMLTAMSYSPYRKLLGTHGLCNSPTSISNYSDKENLSFEVLFDNAAGVITASFYSVEQRNYMLEVKNVLGQIVYSEQINNFSGSYSKQVHLSHLKNGLYLISLSNAYTQSVKKVVLNK